MRLFSSKGLIYFLVHRATQHVLKRTPPSLLLERLTLNKFHKWQNSFLSLSFPLSSPLMSLPHPSHFQRWRVKGGREPMCEPIRNFNWLCTSVVLVWHPLWLLWESNIAVSRSLDSEGAQSGKAKTQEEPTLEIDIGVFVGKGNINSWSQADKSHKSVKEYPQHEEDSWGWGDLARPKLAGMQLEGAQVYWLGCRSNNFPVNVPSTLHSWFISLL